MQHFRANVLYVIVILGCLLHEICSKCTVHEHTDDENTKKMEENLLKKIKPLNGLLFNVSDDKYTYHVRICDKIKDTTDNIGAVQVDSAKNEQLLGRFDQADIMGGKNWILLTYLNGSEYTKHCSKSERMARIMIICNPKLKGEFRLLQEQRRNNSKQCSYWFELGSSVACNNEEKVAQDIPQGLSSGSIFCIIFFTFAGLYLALGFLYKRIVVGSKGIEQIPNYSFWRAFGNLQADACDFICRCGPRQESQAYRGIDDRLKTEEHDDQLLNM